MQILSLPVLAAAICGAALSGCGGHPSQPNSEEQEGRRRRVVMTSRRRHYDPGYWMDDDFDSFGGFMDMKKSPTMVGAWNNHFEAFGAGVAAQDDADPTNGSTAALDKIMLDYDHNSVVRLYDYSAADPKLTTYDTRAAIREMFNSLFPALTGCNGDADDQLKAQTVVDESGGQVFLVWRCARTSLFRATDTFIFDGVIIRNQNIVVAKTATIAAEQAEPLVQFRPMQYAPTTVSEAWTNHANAFMAGAAAGGPAPGRDPTALMAALDKIMLDYDENSVVRAYTFDNSTLLQNPFETHNGTSAIRTMFEGLFSSFTSSNAPVVLQALVVDDPKQVFLIWSAVSSGYKEATDTLVFDNNSKISRQNIAFFMAQ